MALEVFEMTQGAIRPKFRFQKRVTKTKAPIPLTGSTFVLRVEMPAGALELPATVINEDGGIFEFEFAAGDTDEEGSFNARVVETLPDGEDFPWPVFKIKFGRKF
jgi:hypothetical protein